MPHLTLPGVDLWYEDTGGSGTPVVSSTPPPGPPKVGYNNCRPLQLTQRPPSVASG